MLRGDRVEGREFVDACVVDEHIEPTESLLGFSEQTRDLRRLRNIRLDRDGFATCRCNVGYDFVRASFAGGIVDDDRSAGGREMLGDGGADALRGTGDESDLTCQFLCFHDE